jgi:aldehyde:ferredoxin oxidoreductase
MISCQEIKMAELGYAGEILKVNLSDGKITKLPTADYADRFIGGRGMAARLCWDMVPPKTRAFDSKNCLIFSTGPVTGFHGLAGCRWQVCGKSPAMEPEVFSYANLGGKWGASLKYAGYDGLVVQGNADKPVYLYVDNGVTTLRDAASLWGKTIPDTCDTLKTELGKGVSILTIGPAGENMVSFAAMLTDDNASGSSGLASVMGSKKLKAIVTAGNKRPVAAEPERLRSLTNRIHRLRKEMWEGWQPGIAERTKPRPCYGCGIGCFRKSYEAEGGRQAKFFCQASNVYRRPAMKYYGEWTEVVLLANRLCDQYGLDTSVLQPQIEWLIGCYKEGVLNDRNTGLPMSSIGSSEFIEALTGKIALREGFGDKLADGTIKAAGSIGKRAEELINYSVLSRANDIKDYDPRLILTNALLIATETRRPIQQLHEASHLLLLWLKWLNKNEGAFLSSDSLRSIAEKFWGGKAAADFSSYEGKAIAAKIIQDRTYAKESLILCDLLWPVIWIRYAEDHVGDPSLESQVFSAITGREMDEDGLNRIGERIYNLQRAVLLRQGWGGREGDRLLDYLHEEPIQYTRFDRECLVPGKNGEVASRKGAVVVRAEFEKMKDKYYLYRGWDTESGLPTAIRLKELDLEDVAADLEKRELLR